MPSSVCFSVMKRLAQSRIIFNLSEPTASMMRRARSGVEMEDFDPDELNQYIYAEEAEEVARHLRGVLGVPRGGRFPVDMD